MDALRSALKKLTIETSGVEEKHAIDEHAAGAAEVDDHIKECYFVKRSKGFATVYSQTESHRFDTEQSELDWNLFYYGTEYRFVKAGQLGRHRKERIDIITKDFEKIREYISTLGDTFIEEKNGEKSAIFIDEECSSEVINDVIFRDMTVYVVHYNTTPRACSNISESENGFKEFTYFFDGERKSTQKANHVQLFYDARFKRYVCQKVNRSLVFSYTTLIALLKSDEYNRIDDMSRRIYINNDMCATIFSSNYKYYLKAHHFFVCEEFSKLTIPCIVSKAPVDTKLDKLGFPMEVRVYDESDYGEKEVLDDEELDQVNYVVHTESEKSWRLVDYAKRWALYNSKTNKYVYLDNEETGDFIRRQYTPIFVSATNYNLFKMTIKMDAQDKTYNAKKTQRLCGRVFYIYTKPNGVRRENKYSSEAINDALMKMEEMEEDDDDDDNVSLRTLQYKKGVISYKQNKILYPYKIHYVVIVMNNKNPLYIAKIEDSYMIINKNDTDYELSVHGKQYSWGAINTISPRYSSIDIPDLIQNDPPKQNPVWMNADVWFIACGQSLTLPFNTELSTEKANVFIIANYKKNGVYPDVSDLVLDEVVLQQAYDKNVGALKQNFPEDITSSTERELQQLYDKLSTEIDEKQLSVMDKYVKHKGFKIRIRSKKEEERLQTINLELEQLATMEGMDERKEQLLQEKEQLTKTELELYADFLTTKLYTQNKKDIDMAVKKYKEGLDALKSPDYSSTDVLMCVCDLLYDVVGKGLSSEKLEELIMEAYIKNKPQVENTKYFYIYMYPFLCKLDDGFDESNKPVKVYAKTLINEGKEKITIELNKIYKNHETQKHADSISVAMMSVCGVLFLWERWNVDAVDIKNEVIDDYMERAVRLELQNTIKEKKEQLNNDNQSRTEEKITKIKEIYSQINGGEDINMESLDIKIIHMCGNIYNMIGSITKSSSKLWKLIQNVFWSLTEEQRMELYELVILMFCVCKMTEPISQIWFLDFVKYVKSYKHDVWKSYFESILGIIMVYRQRWDYMRQELHTLNLDIMNEANEEMEKLSKDAPMEIEADPDEEDRRKEQEELNREINRKVNKISSAFHFFFSKLAEFKYNSDSTSFIKYKIYYSDYDQKYIWEEILLKYGKVIDTKMVLTFPGELDPAFKILPHLNLSHAKAINNFRDMYKEYLSSDTYKDIDTEDYKIAENVEFIKITILNKESVPTESYFDDESKTMVLVPKITRPKRKRVTYDNDSMDVEEDMDDIDENTIEEISRELKRANNMQISFVDFIKFKKQDIIVGGYKKKVGFAKCCNNYNEIIMQEKEDGMIRWDRNKWRLSIFEPTKYSYNEPNPELGELIAFANQRGIVNPDGELVNFWITAEDNDRMQTVLGKHTSLSGFNFIVVRKIEKGKEDMEEDIEDEGASASAANFRLYSPMDC